MTYCALYLLRPLSYFNQLQNYYNLTLNMPKRGRADDDASAAPLSTWLPQNRSEKERAIRNRLMDDLKKEYVIEYQDWIPPYAATIPARESTFQTTLHQLRLASLAIPDQAQMNVRRFIDPLLEKLGINKGPFHDFSFVYPAYPSWQGFKQRLPRTAPFNLWNEDEEFGQQRLTGMNPLVVERFDPAILKKMPVTNEMLKGLVTPGDTIDSLHKQKRLYMCDYSKLDNLEKLTHLPPQGWFVTPIVLLWVAPNGRLKPLCIQLGSHPDPKTPIFTPKDYKGPWMLAKLFVQQLEVSYHTCIDHVGLSHCWQELFYVSAMRQLSEDHPLNKLIQQHYFFTLNINMQGRVGLMGPQGDVSTLFVQGFKGLKQMVKDETKGKDMPLGKGHFDVNRFIPPKDFAKRGVDDAKALPNYHFREDYLEAWDIVGEYIQGYIDAVYSDNDDVRGDTELQNWIREVTSNPEDNNCVLLNLDTTNGTFTTKEQVFKFIHMIIFSVTFRHGALHNPQFDYISFAPNCPIQLRRGPPTSKDEEYTDEEIAKEWLADWWLIVKQASFFKSVAVPPRTGFHVGEYDKSFEDYLNAHPATKRNLEAFRKRLANMSERIEARDAEENAIVYPMCDPKRVWRSVCV